LAYFASAITAAIGTEVGDVAPDVVYIAHIVPETIVPGFALTPLKANVTGTTGQTPTR